MEFARDRRGSRSEIGSAGTGVPGGQAWWWWWWWWDDYVNGVDCRGGQCKD